MKDLESSIFFTRIENLCGKNLVLIDDLVTKYILKEFKIYDAETLMYNFMNMNNYKKIINGQTYFNISSTQTELGVWVSLYVNENLTEYKIINI